VHGVTIPTAGDPAAGNPVSPDAPHDRRPVVSVTGCTSRPYPASSPVAVVTACTGRGSRSRPRTWWCLRTWLYQPAQRIARAGYRL